MPEPSDAAGSGLRAPPPILRIDRWLWAARFFKTRSTAAAAVSGGKVHLNGQRAKAAQSVASSIATRCPPAEWPETWMRSGSAPKAWAFFHVQATAARFCRTISSMPTSGASA